MAKTQVKYSSVRNRLRRIKRNVKASLGVLCATLLVTAALPSASNAVDADDSSDTGNCSRTALVAIETPVDSSILALSDRDHDARPSVGEVPSAPAPADQGALTSEEKPLQHDVGISGDPGFDEEMRDDIEAPSPDAVLDEADSIGSPDTEPLASKADASSAMAAAPLAADPAGFSWIFEDIGESADDTCMITGYDGGTYAQGTVHVPAANPAGKKVVSIAGGYQKYANLKCGIDFSQAVNLERVESQAFANAGLKGTLDFSKCTKLTVIGSHAFKDAGALTGVVLSPNLASIENYAFMGDGGITGPIILPKSLNKLGAQVFDGCKITSLGIPLDTALSSIPNRAFAGNKIAGSLTFPASIKTVQSSAFIGNQITSVTFQASEISVGNSAFQNNLIANDPISGKVFTVLGSYAFADNKLSGEVSFAKNTASVPAQGIIANNPGVKKVVLSQSWIVIPDEMFKGLTSLIDISIPEGNKLVRVGERAFQGCTSLVSFNFNEAPLSDSSSNGIAIGQAAFQGCSSLKTVKLGTGVFDTSAVSTITVGPSAFKDCYALSYIDIPKPTSGFTKLNIKIGDYAFANTNLGAFPSPVDPSKPLGYLPLDRRSVLSIGAHAFDNAKLHDIKLPNTLTFVGEGAFANNHITNLELPNNPKLDTPGSVGSGVLANQTVDSPAVWGDSAKGGVGKADIILEALHALGLVHDRVDSVGLNVPGLGDNIQPDNVDTWQVDHVATYDKIYVEDAGTTFTYGYEVWRAGGSAPLSHGTVTMQSMDKGVPFTFRYYDADFSNVVDTHVQWVGVGYRPVEKSHGISNFGLYKPGYHTQAGAYDVTANAGWRTGVGPDGAGAPQDPETVVAVDGQTPEFYNRWLSNSYSASFDDNWDWMVQQNAQLGVPDPGGSGETVRNPEYVSGTMADQTGLAYGRPALLADNEFSMGGYAFAGWATSPDVPERDRVEGSNFFPAGSSIATPDPAPDEGAMLTLYAQWAAVDYGADDPALLGFLSIPQNIDLQPDGDRLWSKPPGPDAQPGDHAIPIVAEKEVPGATWPDDMEYRVSVTRPDAGAPLLELVADGEPGKEIQVLKSDGTTPYEPGVVVPGKLPDSLVVIDPKDSNNRKGSFMLRSVDPIGAFKANARYAGTMTFRVDIVQKGATP